MSKVLNVLFWVLKASPVAWTFFQLSIFSTFCHQTPGSGSGTGSGLVFTSAKMPDPVSVTPDPKHCLEL
jgi:hypothetical protein